MADQLTPEAELAISLFLQLGKPKNWKEMSNLSLLYYRFLQNSHNELAPGVIATLEKKAGRPLNEGEKAVLDACKSSGALHEHFYQVYLGAKSAHMERRTFNIKGNDGLLDVQKLDNAIKDSHAVGSLLKRFTTSAASLTHAHIARPFASAFGLFRRIVGRGNEERGTGPDHLMARSEDLAITAMFDDANRILGDLRRTRNPLLPENAGTIVKIVRQENGMLPRHLAQSIRSILTTRYQFR